MSDWYYAANNEQKGPVNESELKAHIASNKIPADTLVWKDGMDNWTPANQLPAFTFRPAPAPAAVQPGTVTPAPAPAVAKVDAPAAAAMPATKVVSAGPDVNNPDSTKPVDLTNIKGMMGTPEALEVDAEDAEKNKIFGILAYLNVLVIVPIVAAPESPFARYHSNQGLVLFLGEIAIMIFNEIVATILSTILPSGLLAFCSAILGVLWLAPLLLLIYGIINAAAGKCVPLPVIGGIKILPPKPKAE